MPWYAKALAACIVAYAFSPTDLISGLVPILGYFGDLVLLPLGGDGSPAHDSSRGARRVPGRAEEVMQQPKLVNWTGAGVIVSLWIATAVGSSWVVVRFL